MGRLATLRGGSLVGAALAILFSVNTVFIIVFSAAGVAGNSTFSGLFLVSCEAAILISSFRSIRLIHLDYLFGGLVLAVTASFAMNGLTAGIKETAIFVVSLAAYPVCRSVIPTDRMRMSFGFTSLLIATIGAFATVYAIYEQWPVPEGKPIVFGNDAAGTHFLTALAFFVIAVTTQELTKKQAVLGSALLFVTSAVFAAALVRFTFASLLLTLGLCWLLSARKQRVYISMITASILFGAAFGTLVRLDKIPVLVGFMTEKTVYRSKTLPPPAALPASKLRDGSLPSCLMEVNMKNSFAERKALWQDSFYLIPRSGLFGFGLDGFMKYSCMRGFPPHNSIFQALIEFGWLGGIALSAMIAISFIRLVPTAAFDDSERFIVCALAFAVIVSLAHGRLSRDFVLFSTLGLAASVLAGPPRDASGEHPT